MAILELGKHKATVRYGFLDLKKSTLVVEYRLSIKTNPLSSLYCSGALRCRELYEILDDDQLDQLIGWINSFGGIE